jgi:hypothetical protein
MHVGFPSFGEGLAMTRWFAAIAVVLTLAGSAPGVEGDWFIRTGVNGVWSSNLKHPACKKLLNRAARSIPTCLAFTAQDDWTLLDGGNSIWTSDTADSVGAQAIALAKAGHRLRWLAFTPQSGWVLLYDKHGYAADGLPASARARLDAVAKAGGTLRSIAFGPHGGWVIVGDNTVLTEGVPEALDKTLRAQVAKRIAVRCVAFTSRGDWFVLNGHNECLASDQNHPAYKKLQELRGRGDLLQWIAFAPGDFNGGMILERKPGKRIKAMLDCGVIAQGGGVMEWMVYAPKAPTLDRQRDVLTTLLPEGKLAQELSPLKRGLMRARLKNRPQAIQVKLTIEATLMTTRLRPRVAGEAPVKAELEPGVAKLYTRASPMGDYKTPAFQGWLDKAKLRRGDDESALAFARRVFRHLKYSLSYEWHDDMDLRASAACLAGKSDCGGMSNLFVAALRAGGVPARAVAGRHATSEKPPAPRSGAIGSQRHVCAEFFADGVGWVPVDVNLAVVDDRRGDFAYFGNDAGKFLVMHVDTDLVVESYAGRTSLPTLQGFCWWRRGGAAQADQMQEHWTVE